MHDPDPIVKITQEINLALQSQEAGNLGKARVCARRAAGWAIQEYLGRQEVSLDTNNALDHIKYFASLEGHSVKMYDILHHLTVKMEKESLDSEAYYPIEGVNLVSEAQWLAEELLQTRLDISF